MQSAVIKQLSDTWVLFFCIGFCELSKTDRHLLRQKVCLAIPAPTYVKLKRHLLRKCHMQE